MAWSYTRLWKILLDRKLKKTDLLTLAHISTTTLSRMGKDEGVSMETLDRLCTLFDCEIQDIVEHIKE